MGAQSRSRPRLWTTGFARVTLVNLLLFMAFYVVMPVMPVYINGPLGGSDVAVGVLSGVFTVTSVIGCTFAGLMLDTLGRRWILLVSMAIFAVGVFGYGVAGSLVVLALFRVVHGVGFAGSSIAASTIAADEVPGERRSEGLGVFGIAETGTAALAPVLGFWLADTYSFSLLFAVSTAVALLTIVTGLGLRQSPGVSTATVHGGGPDGKFGLGTLRSLVEPAALPVALTLFPMALTYGAMMAFMPLYAGQLGLDNPGHFFFVYALANLMSRPLAGRLADRIGAGPVLVPCALLIAGGFGLMWAASSPLCLLAGGALYGVGLGGLVPVLLASALGRSPDQRRGGATATFYAAFDFAMAVGASSMGPVAAGWSYRSVFGVQIVVAVLGLLLLLYLAPSLEKQGPS